MRVDENSPRRHGDAEEFAENAKLKSFKCFLRVLLRVSASPR